MTATTSYDRKARERLLLLLREKARRLPIWKPLAGPQSQAKQSRADIVGYGGAAGGGKTDLAAGLILTEAERALFMRREKAQTEGVIQRLTEILGSTDGFNSQKSIWRIPGRALCEFGGLDNPGDERRWQGRPHDLKVYDEVTEMREQQVRFTMGWCRTNNPKLHARVLMTFNPPTTSEGRWVIEFFGPWLDKQHPLYPTPSGSMAAYRSSPGGQGGSKDTWVDSDGVPLTGAPFVLVDGRVVYDFDPADYTPEQIIEPKSRTFIPARLTDNPYYMASGYMSTLQSLPEPLRSQMLYGDFQAGISDDPWQVIPTAWVDAAMARWKPKDKKPRMDSVGVDVARGGKDKTVISRRHEGMWFDELLMYPGKETPDGPTTASHVIANSRDRAPQHVDVIGVGASAYDFLIQANQPAIGVNVAERATRKDKSGRLGFSNLRSQLWWEMREALDPNNNTGIALPPDKELAKELCAPKWRLQSTTVYVESRQEIIERIGVSPDRATAVILANMDTPTWDRMPGGGVHTANAREYDPYAN
jgi:hypothetical protein